MYKQFSNWLDNVLNSEIPGSVVAFCINLYEKGNDNWSAELIGTSYFDEEDENWACHEVTDFDTRTQICFQWEQIATWEVILEEVCRMLENYLNEGEFAIVLKEKKAVAVGFVDGNLEILYSKLKG